MTNSPNLTLTIEFNDPELDPEERNEQVQLLMRALKSMDEIETIDRVIDPTSAPEGSRSLGVTYLVGLLMTQLNINNAAKIFAFLRERLGNKSIEFTVEANGKKLSVKASSREELDYAIEKALAFIAV
jgi:hypothetical protein